MDESEKKALDDFNFNDMQVEAIKFLAELPKKSLKEGRKQDSKKFSEFKGYFTDSLYELI